MAVKKKKVVKRTLNKTVKRSDWEINNELISDAFFKEVITHKKFPTYAKIAKITNLNPKTVERHLRGYIDDNGKERTIFEDLKVKMAALKDKVMFTLAIKAIEGKDPQWMKLFFEVTTEEKPKDNSGTTIIINGIPITQK